MLQILLKNKIRFLITLVCIWFLIFIVPWFGNYYRQNNQHNKRTLRKQAAKDNVKKIVKPVFKTDYANAGVFHLNSFCLDNLEGKGDVGLYTCIEGSNNQFWLIMKNGLFKNQETCMEGPKDLETPMEKIVLKKCNADDEHQGWKYENEHLMLSGSELCLQAIGLKVILIKCDAANNDQKWKLKIPPGM